VQGSENVRDDSRDSDTDTPDNRPDQAAWV
jgi:hypothetical protein